MSEHIRYARNRREFLTDCFCGVGSLAFASMLGRTQARAARYNPLAPKPPHMPDKAKAKAVIFLYMAGGPSHLETFDPKPLLNQLDGQKRPAEFGEVKYQNVNPQSRILGPSAPSRSTASPASKSPTCSRTRRRSSTISASSAPCTATWWCTPPRSIR